MQPTGEYAKSIYQDAPNIVEKNRSIVPTLEQRRKMVLVMNGYHGQGKTWPQIEQIMWNHVQDLYEAQIKKHVSEGKHQWVAESLAEKDIAVPVNILGFIPFNQGGNEAMIVP